MRTCTRQIPLKKKKTCPGVPLRMPDSSLATAYGLQGTMWSPTVYQGEGVSGSGSCSAAEGPVIAFHLLKEFISIPSLAFEQLGVGPLPTESDKPFPFSLPTLSVYNLYL